MTITDQSSELASKRWVVGVFMDFNWYQPRPPRNRQAKGWNIDSTRLDHRRTRAWATVLSTQNTTPRPTICTMIWGHRFRWISRCDLWSAESQSSDVNAYFQDPYLKKIRVAKILTAKTLIFSKGDALGPQSHSSFPVKRLKETHSGMRVWVPLRINAEQTDRTWAQIFTWVFLRYSIQRAQTVEIFGAIDQITHWTAHPTKWRLKVTATEATAKPIRVLILSEELLRLDKIVLADLEKRIRCLPGIFSSSTNNGFSLREYPALARSDFKYSESFKTHARLVWRPLLLGRVVVWIIDWLTEWLTDSFIDS